MSDAVKTIVILGAGQAGATVALGLRRSGFDGSITLVGEEVHLPYERPQLSKELLFENDRPPRPIKSVEDYHSQSITLELGRQVAGVDADSKQVRLDNGRQLSFDRLVIATGTRAKRLPAVLDGRGGVAALRTIEDACALRAALAPGRSLVIVGGGVIGLEVACAARSRGCEVTVVEAGDRLMSRSVDATVSRFLDRMHRNAGVDIRYRSTLDACLGERRLRLSGGDVLEADQVLVGIGVEPNTRGFEHLGIADESGIRVDAWGRTAIDSIFATGDVASQPIGDRHGRIETWANAQNHAAAVAANLLGQQTRYEAPAWFWSDQGATNIQVVGDACAGRAVARGDVDGDAFSVFRLADAGHVTGATTINSSRDMAIARRWVAQRVRVDPARLADPDVPLRDCVA